MALFKCIKWFCVIILKNRIMYRQSQAKNTLDGPPHICYTSRYVCVYLNKLEWEIGTKAMVAGLSSFGWRAAGGGCVCRRQRRAAYDDLPSQGRSYTCHRPLPAAAITNLSPLHHPVQFNAEALKCRYLIPDFRNLLSKDSIKFFHMFSK